MSRDTKAAANRAHILATARRMFEAHGYEGVSIRDIAAAAQRSTGSVFTYWLGKAELFTEAMSRPPFTDEMGFRAFEALRELDARRAQLMLHPRTPIAEHDRQAAAAAAQ